MAASATNDKPSNTSNLRQVALQFSSSEELDNAIDWLWTSPDLRDMRRIHVGDNTMIVHESSLAHFQKQGFNLTVQPVISAGELTPEELKQARHAEESP